MRSYFDTMLRYFEFSGRSTRLQYWMFFLIQSVLVIGAAFVDLATGGFADPEHAQPFFTLFIAFAHIVPSITVQVRRLHDIGRSGAWLLLNVVPFGNLVLLYWACCASEEGSNGYDEPAPSTYQPKMRAILAQQQFTSIPRQVRMGSARTPAVGNGRAPAPGRFI